MRKLFTVFLLINIHIMIFAGNPFFIVLYDQSCKQELGEFPISREYYAKAIEIAKLKGASAVVLKFFFDKPKNENDDKKLADSMAQLPVFLQAKLDDSEITTNDLDVKAEIHIVDMFPNALSAKSGWLPISTLSEKAYSIGFVDIKKSLSVPIIEKYQDRYVQSLTYAVLKFALPNLKIVDGCLVNGNNKLKISKSGEVEITYPIEDNLNYVALNEFLSGKVEEDEFKGKIIIIGYDGDQIEKIPTPIGNIKGHRVFIYGLISLYKMLE